MKCTEVQSLLKSYYDGSLDEYSKIKIHHHLIQCPHCTEEYDMWQRSEHFLEEVTMKRTEHSSKDFSSSIMSSVMSRIQEEEKWASPSVEVTTTSRNRIRLFASFLVIFLLVIGMLIGATAFIPQTEIADGHVIKLDMMDNWKIDGLVVQESLGTETSMDLQVVASISNPIIYSIAEEEKNPPYLLISSGFAVLLIIIGLSWVTRG